MSLLFLFLLDFDPLLCYNISYMEGILKLEDYKSLFYYVCEDEINEKAVHIFRNKTNYNLFGVVKKEKSHYEIADATTNTMIIEKYQEKPLDFVMVDKIANSFAETMVKHNQYLYSKEEKFESGTYVRMGFTSHTEVLRFQEGDRTYSLPFYIYTPLDSEGNEIPEIYEQRFALAKKAIIDSVLLYAKMGISVDEITRKFNIAKPLSIYFCPLVDTANGFAIMEQENAMLIEMDPKKNPEHYITIRHEFNHLMSRHATQNGIDQFGFLFRGVDEGMTEWFVQNAKSINDPNFNCAYLPNVQIVNQLFQKTPEIFGYYTNGDFEGLCNYTAKLWNAPIDDVKQFMFQFEAFHRQTFVGNVQSQTKREYKKKTAENMLRSFSKLMLSKHFKNNIVYLMDLASYDTVYKTSEIFKLTFFPQDMLDKAFAQSKRDYVLGLLASGKVYRDVDGCWKMQGALGKLTDGHYKQLCSMFNIKEKDIRNVVEVKNFSTRSLLSSSGAGAVNFDEYVTMGLLFQGDHNEIFDLLFWDPKVPEEKKLLLLSVWDDKQFNNSSLMKIYSGVQFNPYGTELTINDLSDKVAKAFVKKCSQNCLEAISEKADDVSYASYHGKREQQRRIQQESNPKKENWGDKLFNFFFDKKVD